MKDTLATYYRTSLEDYDKAHRLADQSHSIENQRKLVLEFLAQNPELSHFQVVEFFDDGLTGTNTERPQFQAMIEAARQGKISCIIVKDLSRFGRNYLDVGDYLEHIFPFLGVRLISVNDGYDSKKFAGKTGGMDIAFRNFIYENYSRDLSVKVRSAMQARMKEGRFVNHVPYGYQKDPADKHRMLPDAVTAPIVREIFLSVIDGKSTTQIAKELNGRGVLTPLAYKQHRLKPTCQGRELMWSHITVLNILHNYKYTGAMTNHVRESRYMRDNNQRRVPREDWIITEDAHEAIVTKDEFEAANAQLRVVKKHDRRPPSSYDNVFYCGHCGRKLRKSFGQDTYFACDTRLYQEDAVCSSIRWSKTDLETVLLPVYKAQLYLLGEKAKQLSANTPATVDWNERLTKIDQEIAACDAWKIKYYEAYRDGEFDRDTFVERKAGLDAKIEMLRTHRAKLETEQRQQQQAVIEQAAASQELSKYLSATSLNDDQLKEHIYRAIESVRVFNDRRIEIQWKFKDLFAVNARTERNAV